MLIHINSLNVGFGGDLYNGFRLWLDGKDPNGSYVRNDDSTYEEGKITGADRENIRVSECGRFRLNKLDISLVKFNII